MARLLLCLLCDNLQTLELSADRSRSLLPRAGESGENHMIFRRRPSLRQIVRDQLWQLDPEYRQTDKQLSATVPEW